MIGVDSAYQFCVLRANEKSPRRALSLIRNLPAKTPELFYDSFEKAAKILPKHIGSKMALTVMKTSRCVSCRNETRSSVERYSLPVTASVIRMQAGRIPDTQTIVQNMLSGIPFKKVTPLPQATGLFSEQCCDKCNTSIEPVREYKLVGLGDILSLLLHHTGPKVMISQTIKASEKVYNLGGVICMGSNGLGLVVCTPLSCSIVQMEKGVLTESRVELREVTKFLKNDPSMISYIGKPIAAIYRYDPLISAPKTVNHQDPDVTIPSEPESDINEDVLKDEKMLRNLMNPSQNNLDLIPNNDNNNNNSNDNKMRRRNFEFDDTINNSYSITQQIPPSTLPYGGTDPNLKMGIFTNNSRINQKPMRFSQRPVNSSVMMPINVDSSSNDNSIDNNSKVSDIMIFQGSSPDNIPASPNIHTYDSFGKYQTDYPRNSKEPSGKHKRRKGTDYNDRSMRGGDISTIKVATSDKGEPVSVELKSKRITYAMNNVPPENILYGTNINTVSAVPYVKSRLITSKVAFAVIICLIIFLVLSLAIFMALIIEYALFVKSINSESAVAHFEKLIVNSLSVIGRDSTQTSEKTYDANNNIIPDTKDTNPIKLDEPVYDLIVYGTISIQKKNSQDDTSSAFVENIITDSMKANILDLSIIGSGMDFGSDIFSILDPNPDADGNEYNGMNFFVDDFSCGILEIDFLSIQDPGTEFKANRTIALNGSNISTLSIGMEDNMLGNNTNPILESESPCTISGEITIKEDFDSRLVEISDASTTNVSFNTSRITNLLIEDGNSVNSIIADTMVLEKLEDLDTLNRSTGTEINEITQVNISNGNNPLVISTELAGKIDLVEVKDNITFRGNVVFNGNVDHGSDYDSEECQSSPLTDLFLKGDVNIATLTTSEANILKFDSPNSTLEINGAGIVEISSLIYGLETPRIIINDITAADPDSLADYNIIQKFEINGPVLFSGVITSDYVKMGTGTSVTNQENNYYMDSIGNLVYQSIIADSISGASSESKITIQDSVFTGGAENIIDSIVMGSNSYMNVESPTTSKIILGDLDSMIANTVISDDLLLGISSTFDCPGVIFSSKNEYSQFDIGEIKDFKITGTVDITNDKMIDITGINTSFDSISTESIDFNSRGNISISKSDYLCSTLGGQLANVSTLNIQRLNIQDGSELKLPPTANFCTGTLKVTKENRNELNIETLSLNDKFVAEHLTSYKFGKLGKIGKINISSSNLSFENATIQVSGVFETKNMEITSKLNLKSTSTNPFVLNTQMINGILVPLNEMNLEGLIIKSPKQSPSVIETVKPGATSVGALVAQKGTFGGTEKP